MTAAPPTLTELSPAEAARFASEHLRGLSRDAAFSAREFLDDNPGCAGFRSVVLQVALEEYVRRSCTGEQVSPSEIAGQFPAHQTAIARQIEVYQLLEETSSLEVLWPEPGDEFLGLQLHELLGVGAFSKVFRATEWGLGNRQVVVKVCHGAGAEAAFLGRLRHPGITPIHWHRVCDDTGLSAIVMPFLARTTMADVIDRCFSGDHRPGRAADVASAVIALHPEAPRSADGALAVPAFRGSFCDGALRWARQLADALAFAHQHSICHSDIKPSNVLMTPGGDAVLVDFSMANDLAIDRKTIGGTFPYMAPEQLVAYLAGGDIPVSFHSDVFSLGATIYEFLTGRAPFGCPPAGQSRQDTAEWLIERQKQGAVPVSRLNPLVPESTSAIVMECLALNPGDRPESATALSARLGREVSVWRSVVNTIRRHRRSAAAAAVSVVIVAALSTVYMSTRPPRFETQLERGRAALLAGDFPQAEERFSSALDEMPPEHELTFDALCGRASARMRQGDYEVALQDFQKAKALEDVHNARISEAMAFCLARLAFVAPYEERASELQRSMDWLSLAWHEASPSRTIAFNEAYLRFRRVLLASEPGVGERMGQQQKAESLEREFEAIRTQLRIVDAEIAETPNYQLLMLMMEFELAYASLTGIDGSLIRDAERRFADDARFLIEAARAYAWNARVSNDPQSRSESLTRCRELWERADRHGATEKQMDDIQSYLNGVPGAPRLARAGSGSTGGNPADLLLNPLDDVDGGLPGAFALAAD